LFAPANTPPEIVAKLRSEVIAVMRTPELVKLLEAQLMTPRHGDHEELSALIQRDLEKWAKVIQTTGMRGAAPN
jgi:tripartite-type tricarboxylate transporter receptor subunit TctC